MNKQTQNTAKKNFAGNYAYRGFELDRVDAQDTTDGQVYWRVVWPDGSCEDAENTLREAKWRADRYHTMKNGDAFIANLLKGVA